MKNIAIITGASSGLGKAFAAIIDKKEIKLDEIWLLGRNKNRLETVAKKLNHKTRIFNLDLSNATNLSAFKKILERQKELNIKVLVNSAGFGIEGEFSKLNYIAMKKLLRVNIEALTSVTYNCINYMKEGARIINIASSAAFLPQPYFSVYAASKAYVLSLTRAIREEVRKKDIFVSAVCPGPIDTDFFKTMANTEKKLQFLGKAKPMQVALHAYINNLNNKGVIVYGIPMKLFNIGAKLMPHIVLMRAYSGLIDVIDKGK